MAANLPAGMIFIECILSLGTLLGDRDAKNHKITSLHFLISKFDQGIRIWKGAKNWLDLLACAESVMRGVGTQNREKIESRKRSL